MKAAEGRRTPRRFREASSRTQECIFSLTEWQCSAPELGVGFVFGSDLSGFQGQASGTLSQTQPTETAIRFAECIRRFVGNAQGP